MMDQIMSSWFFGVAFSEAVLFLVEPIAFCREPFQPSEDQSFEDFLEYGEYSYGQ
jgi:hypothetical protein